MASSKSVKVGTIETAPELGNSLVGEVIPQKLKNKQGKVVDRVAWRLFNFATDEGPAAGSGIMILVKSAKHGMIEVTLFGDCVSAFSEHMYFDPESFGWKEFKAPNIGEFVRLGGAYTKKFKRLEKSSNPELKKGFWATGFRVLDPAQIKAMPRPEKPANLAELQKREAAAKRTGAV
jgi:hypothetical protein